MVPLHNSNLLLTHYESYSNKIEEEKNDDTSPIQKKISELVQTITSSLSLYVDSEEMEKEEVEKEEGFFELHSFLQALEIENRDLLQKQRTLLMKLVEQYPLLYWVLPDSLKEEVEFAEKVMQKRPQEYVFLSENLRKNYHFIFLFLLKYSNGYRFLPQEIQENKKIALVVLQYFPELYPSFSKELQASHPMVRLLLEKPPISLSNSIDTLAEHSVQNPEIVKRAREVIGLIPFRRRKLSLNKKKGDALQ